MGQSNNIATYNDVRAVLLAALEEGGGIYSLPNNGQAIYWRQRVYKFINLLRIQKFEMAGSPQGYIAETQFDKLTLRLDPGDCNVHINIREITGKLTSKTGDIINVDIKDEHILNNADVDLALEDEELVSGLLKDIEDGTVG